MVKIVFIYSFGKIVIYRYNVLDIVKFQLCQVKDGSTGEIAR